MDLEKEGLPYNEIAATVTIHCGLFETQESHHRQPDRENHRGERRSPHRSGGYGLGRESLRIVLAVLKTSRCLGVCLRANAKGLRRRCLRLRGLRSEVILPMSPLPPASAASRPVGSRFAEEHGHAPD